MKINYDEHIKQVEKILALLKEKSNRYTFLRAIVFVCFLFLVYTNIVQLNYLYFFMLVLSIVIFIVLVFKHTNIKKQIRYYENKKEVLDCYLARINDDWSSFIETGEAYKREEYFIAKDLDLLGKHSLFQYLNVAKTSLGKQKLASSLTSIQYSLDEIQARQNAVKELANDIEFSIEVQTLLMDTNKKDDIQVLNELITKIENHITSQHYAWIIRVITLVLMGLSFMQVFGKASASILFLAIVINLAVASIGGLRYQSYFTIVHSLSESLNHYPHIFHLIEKKNWQSIYLNETLKDIKAHKATQGIEAIHHISEHIHQRQNAIGYFILNGLFIYDLLCVDELAKWKKDYGKDVMKWFDQLGELEAMLSLAILPQTKNVTTYPTIIENPLMIDVTNIYHPLMQEEKSVGNSFQLVHQVNIITGSNMSGKTTFLRTLGINMVLSFAGGAICANHATISYMHVLTSMRIEDELSSGTSTFYAELKRIKQMIDKSEEDKAICCFIDEIFKGTNSADRIVGAKAAIERLMKENVIVFVSTHDFELCDLEKNFPVSNYHFKEDYKDKQILFDYHIRLGRSQTTNAKFLLEMVGIIK